MIPYFLDHLKQLHATFSDILSQFFQVDFFSKNLKQSM